jgi:hypothetical protein
MLAENKYNKSSTSGNLVVISIFGESEKPIFAENEPLESEYLFIIFAFEPIPIVLTSTRFYYNR